MSEFSPYCVVRADILSSMPDAHKFQLGQLFVDGNVVLDLGSMADLMATLMLDPEGHPWVYWQDPALSLDLVRQVQAVASALGYEPSWIFWCTTIPDDFRPVTGGNS